MLTHKIGNSTVRNQRDMGRQLSWYHACWASPEDLRSSPASRGESAVASACYPSTESVETDRSLGIPKACGLKPASYRPIKMVSQMTIWKAPKNPHLRSTSDLHTYIHRGALPHPTPTHTKRGGIRHWEWERMFYKGNDWMLIHCSKRWWARMTKRGDKKVDAFTRSAIKGETEL